MRLLTQTYVDLAASRPDVPSLFSSPGQIVATIFNFISLIAGVVFVCLILFAGITYLLGAGDDNQTGKAKKMLTTSVVGLFITLSAWAGGGFILDKLFGRSAMTGRPATNPAGQPTNSGSPSPSPSATQVENLNTTVMISADGTPAGITLFVLPYGSSATTLAELQAAALASGTAGVDGQIPLNFNYTITSDPQMFRVVLLRDDQRVDTSYTALGLEGATISWPFPANDEVAGQETTTTQFRLSLSRATNFDGIKVFVLPEDAFVTSETAAEANKLGGGAVDANGRITITFSYTPPDAGTVRRFRVLAIRGNQSEGEVLSVSQLENGPIVLHWSYPNPN